ncbi:MAG: glycosyl hydrolase family 28-related protein [Chloroflexota bacterium]
MTIREVLAVDTPNDGRTIWNENDRELEQRLNALALNVTYAPYNAQGDGVADDQPAIQSAIDDCHNAGGGYIYLPAGTYMLNSGSLILKDNIGLTGAGKHNTILRLGNGVNAPVITDDSAGIAGSHAFGRVHLSHFGIQGNQENNPDGREGIFTTAYYSVFEHLEISECQTHGIRMGFDGMTNVSSQNRVVGCRIALCGGAGVYFDINGVDHTVSENYIRNCDFGVIINNGGVRVVNNGLFGHARAAVQVRQTAYNIIIASNDLNANNQHAIYVTRTTVEGSGPWSQMLISGNSILGDFLEADDQFDGIHVETSVPAGINQLTITGNKIFTRSDSKNYRYGIHLANNVVQAKCSGNHISNTARSPYEVGENCVDINIDSIGGGILGPPTLPQSGESLINPYHTGVTVYLSGGDVTGVAIGGHETGMTSGSFRISAGQSITVAYRDVPTWTWFAD